MNQKIKATLLFLLGIVFWGNAFAVIPELDAERQNEIHPVVCTGAESSAAVSYATYHCAGAHYRTGIQYFRVVIRGIEIAAQLAVNGAIGWVRGPIQEGAYSISFRAGVYKGIGGVFINASNLTIFGPGVGWGGVLSYGVAADSLFGGQVTIEVVAPKAK